MAGNGDEGDTLVDKPSGSQEKSQDNATGEKESRKQKKAGNSRDTPKNKPSSSKTTVTKTDFVESIKASISESMVEGFRQISSSLSAEIAGVLSSTARIPSKRPRKELSDSDSELESDENVPQKRPRASSLKDGNESVDLSLNDQVDSLFTKDSSKTDKTKKTEGTIESDFLGTIAAEYDLDEACSADVDAKLAKIVNKMVRTKLSDEKLKEKLLTSTRPANCENVTATKVNPEVW